MVILHAIQTGGFEVKAFYVQPTPRDNMDERSQAAFESIVRTLAAAELVTPHLPSNIGYSPYIGICQYISRRAWEAFQSNGYPSVPSIEQEAWAMLSAVTTRPTSSYEKEVDSNFTLPRLF